jgi:phage-related protein
VPDTLPKKLLWRGSSKADFVTFPIAVQREVGYALYVAQMGERHPTMAKTLTGFGSATVLEIKESASEGTFRAIYAVRFVDAVYVLHAFQKKSKKDGETPKPDMATIKRRLAELIAERTKS